MNAEKSAVVISHLPEGIDLRRDYVALPRNYTSPAYFARPDIQAIYRLVEQNLTALDECIHFTRHLAGKRVIIKPNLVTVYHRMGLVESEYPETTDPRLLDAVLAYFKRFTHNLVIVESSGRGVPTRGSFAVAGIDRLARFHKAGLIALEEQPTLRYFLPRARVQKEIIVPAIIGEVVRGEAFFVSLPKLKTNLYTGVTLGFKNAMGLLPYNLRQRYHRDVVGKLVQCRASGRARIDDDHHGGDPQNDDPGEEQELRDERNRLANAVGLAAAVQEALQLLDEGMPEAPAASEVLGQVTGLLATITRLDPKQSSLGEQMQSIQEAVVDLSANLRDYLERVEFNPKRLDQVEERLNLIHNLTRKYGANIQEVLDFAEKSRQQLDAITHAGERIAVLEKEEQRLLLQLAREGMALSEKRQNTAKLLEKAVEIGRFGPGDCLDGMSPEDIARVIN